MQISVDVHNYMETLVGHVLAESKYSSVLTQDQMADLACLALIQLRPVYIRHDIDFLSALPETRLVALKESASAAVESSLGMILEDRRSNRDDDIPVIFSHPRLNDDDELDWFETPILKTKK